MQIIPSGCELQLSQTISFWLTAPLETLKDLTIRCAVYCNSIHPHRFSDSAHWFQLPHNLEQQTAELFSRADITRYRYHETTRNNAAARSALVPKLRTARQGPLGTRAAPLPPIPWDAGSKGQLLSKITPKLHTGTAMSWSVIMTGCWISIPHCLVPYRHRHTLQSLLYVWQLVFFYYYYFYLILLFFTLLHFNCTLAFASIRAACGYFYVCTAKITFQIQPNFHLSRWIQTQKQLLTDSFPRCMWWHIGQGKGESDLWREMSACGKCHALAFDACCIISLF